MFNEFVYQFLLLFKNYVLCKLFCIVNIKNIKTLTKKGKLTKYVGSFAHYDVASCQIALATCYCSVVGRSVCPKHCAQTAQRIKMIFGG